jgi:Ca-activated chloride channel family protein
LIKDSNTMSHDSADTRVTAYVFGELSEDQHEAFEQELAQSSQLRDEVASVEEAVAAIRAELDAETTGVDATRRKEIEQAIGDASTAASTVTVTPAAGGRKLMAMMALAASVLIVSGLVYTNLPEDRELSMADERASEPAVASIDQASIADAADSITSDPFSEKVENLAMKGGYDRGSELLSQSRSEEELSRVAGRQLGRSSTELSQDDPLAAGGIVAGKGGVVSELDEITAQGQSRSSRGRNKQAAGRYDIAGDPVDAYSSETAPQPSKSGRSNSPRAVGAVRTSPAGDDGGQQAAPRGGTAAAQSAAAPASASRMMREQQGKDEFGVNLRADVELSDPASQPDDLQLLVRPQVIVTEELGEGIATKQGVPRRRRRRSDDQLMEMEEMMMSGGAQVQEAQVQQQGVGYRDANAGGMGGSKEPQMGMDMMDMDMDMMGMDMGMGMGMAGDRYEPIEDNPFMKVGVGPESPLSTFSVDVDTAAYAKVRMYLMQQNTLPRPAAVRIEELVNYFRYNYTPPTDEHPFAATMDVAECPWNPAHRLARIGIKGKVIDQQRPPSNLVFLLDVSGSMNRPNKLPLVIEGMTMLAEQLGENDSVAIVVYAGQAGLVLDSTSGDQKQTIISALQRLRAGGSTDGGSGIKLAYDIARDHFIVGGTNRVILCTDGDFNVGVTGTDELTRLAEENAKSNVYLSILGFGMGNHNDEMMEKVSNQANGNYAFIDSKSEANKVLVEEIGATLVTIAKDVKIQVEFNPSEIDSYRLIGYENRIMAAQDFNDDTKDAGEIGAGHTVTALYELVPAGADSNVTIPPVDDLRYQKKARLSKQAASGEALILKLRYKKPDAAPDDESTLIQFPVVDYGKKFSEMDEDFQFASSVASFGMLLRKSPHKGDSTFAAVEEIAAASAEDDPSGYRGEFLQMVARAKELSGE